jgi:hypothetical protein
MSASPEDQEIRVTSLPLDALRKILGFSWRASVS